MSVGGYIRVWRHFLVSHNACALPVLETCPQRIQSSRKDRESILAPSIHTAYQAATFCNNIWRGKPFLPILPYSRKAGGQILLIYEFPSLWVWDYAMSKSLRIFKCWAYAIVQSHAFKSFIFVLSWSGSYQNVMKLVRASMLKLTLSWLYLSESLFLSPFSLSNSISSLAFMNDSGDVQLPLVLLSAN